MAVLAGVEGKAWAAICEALAALQTWVEAAPKEVLDANTEVLCAQRDERERERERARERESKRDR